MSQRSPLKDRPPCAPLRIPSLTFVATSTRYRDLDEDRPTLDRGSCRRSRGAGWPTRFARGDADRAQHDRPPIMLAATADQDDLLGDERTRGRASTAATAAP